MYDFVIIGGGIIGMSTAMQLIDVYPDARIALLEKESGPACHQTGHNSGVIHAGVYYTPGSLKAQFCLAGNRATKAFCDQNGIRYDNCGKMLVATSELEMERMRALWERGGNFFQPTILVDVPANAKVSKEETFGPLAPLFRFKDEADVIAQANDTEFGLAAYFYARDLSRVFRVGEALEYGIVGINTGIISNEVAPFGGIKASGLGREGSKYGIEDYLEIKYMCIGL
ncbi:aldehyde dehydrogenase family protein [Escherichia coli]|nr:aldehyde dehydrogenase family protein [Escherichia coli]